MLLPFYFLSEKIPGKQKVASAILLIACLAGFAVNQFNYVWHGFHMPNDLPYSDNSRGLGPAEMAQAIEEGRPNVANKEQALHVVAVMEAIMESSEKHCFIPVKY
jgi:hypothetical protein